MTLPPGHRTDAVAELVRGKSLLDVGAGRGTLGTTVPLSTYVPVDADRSVLARGGVTAVATALPFRDEAFDAATCISVLQYVVDVEGAVRELRRVTRESGQVLVLVPNLAYLRNVLLLLRGRLPWSSAQDDWRSGTIRYFTLHDLQPMLRRVGLRLRAVRCSGRCRWLRSFAPSRFGADLLIDLERVG